MPAGTPFLLRAPRKAWRRPSAQPTKHGTVVEPTVTKKK